MIDISGTGSAHLLRAILYLPARHQLQQPLDSGDTDALVMDQITNTTNPVDVVVGKIPLVASATGTDQPLFLVNSDGAGMNVEKFRRDAYGIDGLSFLWHKTSSKKKTNQRGRVAEFNFPLKLNYTEIRSFLYL